MNYCGVLREGVGSGVFNLRLSRPIGLLPFSFPFRSAFVPPPVLHRWRRGLATNRAGLAPPHSARHRRRVAVGPKRRGKGWGTREKMGGGLRVVTKPGSHRCRTGGEPEDGERGIQGNQSRNGNGYARKREIRPECDKLNTPGRESFSEKVWTMWLVVARKRLPPPSATPPLPIFSTVREDTPNKGGGFGVCRAVSGSMGLRLASACWCYRC